VVGVNAARERGWWYDVEWRRCHRCRGIGERVECYDDLCHAQGRCMHDPANNVCSLCGGTVRITRDLDERWSQRGVGEAVTAPEADLWNQRKLHAVACERREGGDQS
jgi:hypothetical protein